MENSSRLKVQKTYKIFIDGKFPRSESGRCFEYPLPKTAGASKMSVNVSLSSRKDLRDAVTAARNAQGKWAMASAYNRGQILYRIAEMLEGRRSQFTEELTWQGVSEQQARAEVTASVDRLVYYAGWSDKYQQLFSSVNPVASSHFNFSMLEPTGVVGIIGPESPALLGLISLMAPIIIGGNSCVVLSSSSKPLSSVTFAEVLETSDVPAGVVNILTGKREELESSFASHMDLNSLAISSEDKSIASIEKAAADSVKRVHFYSQSKWSEESAQGPWMIHDHQEVKTVWHPIGG